MKDREIENEDLVNVPNWLVLTIRIDDGHEIRPDEVEILTYRQDLHLREGLLVRRLRFRDGEGRITRWDERRLVSMADEHVAALSVTVTAENWSGHLTVRSELDGSVINDGVARYRELESNHLEVIDTGEDPEEADVVWLRARTVQSRVEVAEAARARLFQDGRPADGERVTDRQADLVAQELSADLAEGESATVEKVCAIVSSRDHAISEPALAARHGVRDAGSFDDLLSAHRVAWRHLWEVFDLETQGADAEATNLKLRLHVFHLLQTVSPFSVGRDVGVPPRGWHGEAYRGHIMWDELFIFPFLSLRRPLLTRALLLYRYRRLPAARRMAREEGCAGALYPWQSGSSGREESQVIHLNPQSGNWIPDNSHRQRHINCAIAHNVWTYFEVTGDRDFLTGYGAEMLIEIARYFASKAVFNHERGRYEIRGVMGPDEFHTAYPDADPTAEGGLDNNAYTNVMTAWLMNRARDALDIVAPDARRRLVETLALSDDELGKWDEIATRLFVPFHDDGIISQFEGYGDLLEFDWDGYRKKYGDIQRLDRILEAEGDSPNRYKASKQADVLMLFYLFSADEITQLLEQLGYDFDRRSIPRQIDYYLERTSHGSTLSWVVHAWVLARSNRRRSWRLFQCALDSDVADIQGGTTREGIHLGAMAGTVDLLQRGYLGIETRGGILHFNPALPDEVSRLSVTIRYRGHTLDVTVHPETLRVESRHATAGLITVGYRGRFRAMSPGTTHEFRLVRHAEREAGRREDRAEEQIRHAPAERAREEEAAE